MRAPWTPLLLVLLAVAASADAPGSAFDAVREGLLSPGRGAREDAGRRARVLARTDPGGVAALWDGLELPGRCLLVHALAAAGTRHAAEVALARAAAAPEEELFRALLDGLAEGGEASLFAPEPADIPDPRRAALEELRFRYRVEAMLVAIKSPWGPTGHYTGQFERLRELGPQVIPILFDITMDRARPLPGESAAGPYQSIHPGMMSFDPGELRNMAAYAFGEVVDRRDIPTIARLLRLQREYDRADENEFRREREDLAPALAFSLFDLGVTGPAEEYVAMLRRRLLREGRWVSRETLWDLGFACIRIGKHEEGEQYYMEVLEVSPSKALAAYNLACNFSVRASEEKNARWRDKFKRDALAYLGMAIKDFGYGDWKWMEEDGDLAFIRKEPQYQELLRYLQRKYPERKKGNVPKGRSFLKPK